MDNYVSNGDKQMPNDHSNVDMLSSIHANMFPEGERAMGEALVIIYIIKFMSVCVCVCLSVCLSVCPELCCVTPPKLMNIF